MTRTGVRECVEAVRGRCLGASKKEKNRVLDEFAGVVGCHRKSAIRLMGRRKPSHRVKGGGGRVYKGEVVDVLKMAWEAADRLLEPSRRRGDHRFSLTKPGTLIKNSIPIRTFADWDDERPGFLEVDLVHH